MKKTVIMVSLALLLLGAIAGAYFIFFNNGGKTQTVTQAYWPDGAWRTSAPEEQGMDSAVLADMITAVNESGKNVNSITIIRNGYLVNETCFYPYRQGIKHAMNSCTKSFVSALTGAAIEDGDMGGANDRVLDFFPDLDIQNIDARKQDMNVSDLLSMTTGLNWQFDGNASTIEMLQSSDWTKYTLDLPMDEKPGTSFNYCNGAANVAASIIEKATGKTPEEYAMERLKPLRMDMYWSASPEGVSAGYSGIFITPGDAAKLGYLYLNKGNWNGEQLIPESWIAESTRTQVDADWNSIFPGYGYYWWITRFDGYAALGFGGNYIFVVPGQNLVVVFTGGIFDTNDLFYPGELMEQYVIPSIKGSAPLQSNGEAYSRLCAAVDKAQNVPAPQTVTLPETALRISDKTYNLDNGSVAALYFEEGSDEFTVSVDSQTYAAGLDGIYRITDAGGNGSLPDHNQVALKGGWIDQDTLEFEIRSLADGFIMVYTARFENDTIHITIKSNLGSAQAVTGRVWNGGNSVVCGLNDGV
jgi:Beta-lactamase class C and other penicillin binding proteins